MSETDEHVSLFVDACILIAEADLEILANHKNPELHSKVRYYAPSALEALAQLDTLFQRLSAAEQTDTSDASVATP